MITLMVLLLPQKSRENVAMVVYDAPDIASDIAPDIASVSVVGSQMDSRKAELSRNVSRPRARLPTSSA